MNKALKQIVIGTSFITTLGVGVALVESEQAQAKTSTYTVKSGDYLSGIAIQHGMGLSELKSLNDLDSDFIWVGQKLKVKSLETKTTKKATTTVAKKSSSVIKQSSYKVISGDTLSGIAYKHGTTVDKIKQLNKMINNNIYVGQSLKLSNTTAKTVTTKKVSVKKVAVKKVSVKKVTNVTGNKSIYTVASGDSLSGIANKYKTTVANIKTKNNLKSDVIYVGQKLSLNSKTAIKETTVSKPKTTTIKKVSNSVSTKTYTVQSGDYLSKIANLYNTTVSHLQELNNLQSTNIYVGQKLKVSGKATVQKTQETSKPTSTSSNPTNNNVQLVSNPTHLIESILTSTKNNLSNSIIKKAESYLGVPYVWGGSSDNGLDCSGLVYKVYNAVGIPVPRTTSRGFYAMATKIAPSQVAIGDLVFFAEDGVNISHISIYYGNGYLIHASGDRVNVQKLNNTYWNKRIVGYGRIR